MESAGELVTLSVGGHANRRSIPYWFYNASYVDALQL